MRQIKFRGKHLDNGEWIYGDLYHTNDLTCICDWSIRPHTVENFAVDPATVGQYTGLKDKNGKEIYEGDIVKRTANMRDYAECDGDVVQYFEVEYQAPGMLPFSEISSYMKEYEVIGNIHDNPELIKQE